MKLTHYHSWQNSITRKLFAVFSILYLFTFTGSQHSQVFAESISQLTVKKDHSEMIDTQSGIVTVALGNPNIADTMIVSPNRLLINGINAGATSLTVILENGSVKRYQILVTQDLSVLRNFLFQLDPNIQLMGDSNGDSVILMGTVQNRKVIDKAVESTVRFLGTSEISLSNVERTGNTNVVTTSNATREGSIFEAGNSSVVRNTSTHRQFTPKGFTETIKSGDTRVVNLLVAKDSLEPPGVRLTRLLSSVDSRIQVKDVNGVYYLSGNVKTPAALVRALTLANSFSGSESLSYEVISDQGGVLLKTGVNEGSSSRRSNTNNNASKIVEQFTDLDVRGIGSRRLPVRGNIRQNIARGDVISVADGKVISMVHVEVNPRVEIKMRIVSIDREKTDELGVNWQIQNNRMIFNNLTDNIIGDFIADDNGVITSGRENLWFSGRIGSSTVTAAIRALEANGAARTLSEPLLTVLSGETANYLVGGEVPITTSQTDRTFSSSGERDSITKIIYRDFGIIMNLRPTVLENGRIAISLDQNISEPDYSTNAFLGGVPIPSFATKSIQTFTEAGDGETWAVAGLLSYEDRKNIQSVPWLSNIPVLGALFKNNYSNKKREELVITVTARTVTSLNSYAGAGEFPKHKEPQHTYNQDDALLNDQLDISENLLLPSEASGKESTSLLSNLKQKISGSKNYHLPDNTKQTNTRSNTQKSEQNKRTYQRNRPFGL